MPMSAPVQSPQAQAIIRWAIFWMSILTYTFACFSVGHCSFIKEEDFYGFHDVDAGLFLYNNGWSGCQKYDDVDFNAPQNAARVFGVLLMISMPCILVTAIISTFFLGNGKKGQAILMSLRILVLVSIFCQSFTFLFLKDIKDASLGKAGKISAMNLIFLVALSVLTWLVPPRDEAMNASEKQTIRWTIFGMSILTFIFACVSVGTCSFIKDGVYYSDSWGGREAGLFSYKKGDGGCEKYDDEDFKGPQQAARVSGALLVFSMFCVLVTTVISTFFLGNGTIGLATWISLRILVLVSIFFQSFTFLFLKDVEGPSLGAPGKIAVWNLILLAALSFLTWVVPPREEAMVKQCTTSEESVTPQPVKTEEDGVPPPSQPEVSHPEEPTSIGYPNQNLKNPGPQSPNTAYAPATPIASEEDIA